MKTVEFALAFGALLATAGCESRPPPEWPATEFPLMHLLVALELVVMDDGNLAICGGRKAGDQTGPAAIAVVTAERREVWRRDYPGLGLGGFEGIDRTVDGGLVVVGTTGERGGPEDISVVCLNGTGETLWTRTIGGPAADEARSANW